jgi:hypothetical protein
MNTGKFPKDWADARRQLAIDRSNQDAEQSNEHLRSAAQATILINGGAATAVLAFISASIGKDKFDAQLIASAGHAIMAYAVGVACSPFVIWFMNIALKHWNQSWQQVLKDPGSEVVGTKEHKLAVPWYKLANLFLFGAIASFVWGSWILSQGFINAPSLAAAAPTHISPVTPPPSSPAPSAR